MVQPRVTVNLSGLGAFLRRHLLEQVTPFRMSYAIDHERGGIFSCINDEGVESGQVYLVAGPRALDL
jgi:mannose/cellobiose epimerase-like protein (N-acyl-D-glucosamine 2-epimerase family)